MEKSKDEHTTPLVLDPSNVSELYASKKVKYLLGRGDLYHKITVQHDGALDKEAIIKTVIDIIPSFHHGSPIVATNVVETQNQCSFLVRQCRTPLEGLFQKGLFHKVNGKNFIITVTLGSMVASSKDERPLDTIFQLFIKRLRMTTWTLNLDDFHKDMVSCGTYYIFNLKSLQHFLPLLEPLFIRSLQVVRLGNNNISSLYGAHNLNILKSLNHLDFRNNQIENVSELMALKGIKLTELWLDGNPLCEDYADEATYVKAVQNIFPQLEKLDGMPISSRGIPTPRRNYACTPEALNLVDTFMEHYFNGYDSQSRECLTGWYHQKAVFSISSAYLPGQSTSVSARLQRYNALSRNLLKLSDVSRSYAQLYQGQAVITACLKSLPPTEHDPYTFTVDIMYHDETKTIFTITGVFKEPTPSMVDPEPLFGFCRTFCLVSIGNDEYQICNETLFISNATTVQARNAFKIVKVKLDLNTLTGVMSKSEQKQFVEMISEITEMNLHWSRRCLEECVWNMKAALQLFINLHKDNKIPPEAFIKSA